MMRPPRFVFCFCMALAATPPNPVLDEAPPRPTALSAVFRRMASESPPAREAPELLGFPEPIAEVPSVEEFLPSEPAAEPAAPKPGAPPASDLAEIAVLEPADSVCEFEPARELAPAPQPEPPPIRARPREFPAAPAPAASPARGPQNLVGRLGVRPEPQPAPRPATAPPRFEPLPSPAPPPAAHRPAPALKTSASALKTPAPAPAQPGGDRAGRPSLRHNRRVYRRAKLPAEIEIGGVPCTLIDVSIGGFAATGVPPLEPNALVPVSLRLTIDGIEVGTQLAARIIYVTQGRSSGRFVDLSPSQMAFLRYIVTWRGESVGAVGTTTLLDAIAGGGDRGFASAGGTRTTDEAPKSRWWAGLVGRGVKPPR